MEFVCGCRTIGLLLSSSKLNIDPVLQQKLTSQQSQRLVIESMLLNACMGCAQSKLTNLHLPQKFSLTPICSTQVKLLNLCCFAARIVILPAEAKLVIDPRLDSWSRLEPDKIVVQTLDAANARVISNVLGQSVALDSYNQ